MNLLDDPKDFKQRKLDTVVAWDGSSRWPDLPLDTLVRIRRRCDDEMQMGSATVSCFRWAHMLDSGRSFDIVEYQVVRP